MAQVSSDTPAVLASLLRSSSITDHDEILTAANAAIQASPSDVVSHRTRIVALLKLDRFDDALRALSAASEAVQSACVAERAYALYKTGNFGEAAVILSSAPPSSLDLPVAHVAAQVAYRAERYPDAYRAYVDLLRRPESSAAEANDLTINLAAASAQLFWTGDGGVAGLRDVPDEARTGSFEMCYNTACECIARGHLEKAAVCLDRALGLCNAAEDLSEEERTAERMPIQVQKAYVLARLGRPAEAGEILDAVVVGRGPLPTISSDELDTLALSNRIAAAAGKGNPYLQHRELQSTRRAITSSSATAPTKALSGFQRRLIERNLSVADLKAQKFSGIESRTSRSLSAPDALPSTDPVALHAAVLNAAAHCREQSDKPALRALQALLCRRPDDVGLVLTIVHLQVSGNDHEGALRTLRTFLHRLESRADSPARDARFAPGIVALSVALFRHLGREPPLRAELAKAIEYWTKQRGGSDGAPPLLTQEAGIELLQSPSAGHLAAAGAAFESLCNAASSEKNEIAEAGLVASFATTDMAGCEEYASALPGVHDLVAGVDVDALIRAGVAARGRAAAAAAGSASRKRPAEDGTPQGGKPSASKRRRKPKVPKSAAESGRAPDPERWLPLRDRSYYRPKGKKARRRAGESTQGGVVRDEEMLELVGGAGAVKVEKAPAPLAGVGNKKKKKGRK